MKKIFIALGFILVFALSLRAQTLIQDTYSNLDGTPFNGEVRVTAPQAFTGGGYNVTGGMVRFPISNGKISLRLVPTDSASPAFTYAVQFVGAGGNVSPITYWSVPTSANPVTLIQITVAAAVPANTTTAVNCFVIGLNAAGLNCPNGFQASSGTVAGALDLFGTNGLAVTLSAPATPAAYVVQFPAAVATMTGQALKVASIGTTVINGVTVPQVVLSWQ